MDYSRVVLTNNAMLSIDEYHDIMIVSSRNNTVNFTHVIMYTVLYCNLYTTSSSDSSYTVDAIEHPQQLYHEQVI